MTTEVAKFVLALCLLSLAGLGCRSAASQNSIHVDIAKVPAELRADYASFATNCSKCHSLSRPLNAQVSETRHWDLYVARMMRTAGSAISPEEAPKILRFLYWYTGTYKKKTEYTEPALESPEASSLPAESAVSESDAKPTSETSATIQTGSSMHTDDSIQAAPTSAGEGEP